MEMEYLLTHLYTSNNHPRTSPSLRQLVQGQTHTCRGQHRVELGWRISCSPLALLLSQLEGRSKPVGQRQCPEHPTVKTAE